MDTYGRRKLVAAILVTMILVIGLIGEAMQDKTLRNRAFACLAAIATGLVIIAALLWMLATGAMAHDHNRPELNDWYKSLQSGKGPCCDGSDFGNGTAAVLDDPDVDNTSGHYRVRIEGEWTDVEDSAVLDIPNRDGRAIVWFYHVDGHPKARCFLPGAGT